MRWFIGFNRLLLAGVVAAAAVLSLAQVAQAGPPPPVVPEKIQVACRQQGLPGRPRDRRPDLLLQCLSGFVWAFVAPRANLYNDHGKLIITHFAGPTWQAKDGSRVVGLAEKKPSPSIAPPSPGCGCRPRRRPLALTATGWWPRPTSNGSPPPAASRPRPRTATRPRQEPWPRSHTPPITTSGSGPAADATPLPGRATSGASRSPPATLAVAGGLALVVAVALYAFGRTHTPSYAMGLFGHHDVAIITRQPNGGMQYLYVEVGQAPERPHSSASIIIDQDQSRSLFNISGAVMITRLSRGSEPAGSTTNRSHPLPTGTWTIHPANSIVSVAWRTLRLWTIAGCTAWRVSLHLDELPPLGVICSSHRLFQQPSGLPSYDGVGSSQREDPRRRPDAMLGDLDVVDVMGPVVDAPQPKPGDPAHRNLAGHGDPHRRGTAGLVELRFEVDPRSSRDVLVLRGRGCWIDGPSASASGPGSSAPGSNWNWLCTPHEMETRVGPTGPCFPRRSPCIASPFPPTLSDPTRA